MLYLIEILHQTTTQSAATNTGYQLYLIEILHQTTTDRDNAAALCSCILLKFYIKPQLTGTMPPLCAVVSYWNSTSNHNPPARRGAAWRVVSYWNSTSNHNTLHQRPPKIMLYLIEILHQTTTKDRQQIINALLYLIEILHQTTTLQPRAVSRDRCILLKFYIKPQPTAEEQAIIDVVSYWNSTSNHNWGGYCVIGGSVVSYWNSTSNHNIGRQTLRGMGLYLIEILHQTTTHNRPQS